MTHQLIASQYPQGHVVVRPGRDGAVRIGAARYAELRDAPVELRTRPPESPDALRSDTLPTLGPDGIEFVADTDTLLKMCSCSGSSDQPYAG